MTQVTVIYSLAYLQALRKRPVL